VVYSLTGCINGYNLTNITVYGGWADRGRDQQAYTVYYATVAAPTNFIPLGSVNCNPAIGGGIQSATRLAMTSSDGVLATNVAAVKFDFSSPASENGYCGYAAINVFGIASVPPPPTLSATLVSGMANFVMNVGGLSSGQAYVVQSSTNLTADAWSTETNFVAAQATASFTNSTTNYPQKFYRIVGN
jgi:hypothetical protein